MFIHKVTIENFKAFYDEVDFEFSAPSGKLGSGLNIFVGGNNTGKSTLIEGIDFLRNGLPKGVEAKDIQNKKSKEDFSVEVIFSGHVLNTIKQFGQGNKQKVLEGSIYKEHDRECFRIRRDSKNVKAILLWKPGENKFKNESGIDAPIKKLFELDYIWADTSPEKITAFGSTTICGKLISEITKTFKDDPLYKNFLDAHDRAFNDAQSGLKGKLSNISKRTEDVFREQFGEVDINFHFEQLDSNNFLKNTKIEVNDGVNTFLEQKGDGMQRAIALALLQVYGDELSKATGEGSPKPFYLFIDEPEICLHPQAQKRLLSALKEIAKKQQVFISTHSPYFCDPDLIMNVVKFKKTADQKIEQHHLKNLSLKKQLKENRNFFFRHRDLFFADKAIFVEGVEDYERYAKFCTTNDLSGLIEHFFIMNGCDPTFFFEMFCQEFGIQFFAIVDQDFSVARSKWSRSNRKQFLKDIKDFIIEKDIKCDWESVEQKMKEKLIAQPRKDEREAVDITKNKIAFSKVKGKEIFVLKCGEVKDYLNKDGTIKDSDAQKKNELMMIFSEIKSQ